MWLLKCIPKKKRKDFQVWGGPGSECCGDAFNSEAGGPINNNTFPTFYIQRGVSWRIFVGHLRLLSNVLKPDTSVNVI